MKGLSQENRDTIRTEALEGLSQRQVAAKLDISRHTVSKYWPHELHPNEDKGPSLPDPSPETSGLELPDSLYKPRETVQVDGEGWWGALGDLHLPMHDKSTIELSVDLFRRQGVSGVLLNGDVMDMFNISPFFREPTDDKFVDEIHCGRQFFAWLRSRLPKARIIFREGNHEYRFKRYIVSKAPELFDMPEFSIQSLLHLDKYGIEWIQDKRNIRLGKLNTLHGHEWRKGEGVNPARLAFLRGSASVLVHHYHRTSEHPQVTLEGKQIVCYSVGCACWTRPDYDPYGQANHGFALVKLEADGSFMVNNRKVLDNKVV